MNLYNFHLFIPTIVFLRVFSVRGSIFFAQQLFSQYLQHFLGKYKILKIFSTYIFYTIIDIKLLPGVSVGVERYHGTPMEIFSLKEHQLLSYIALIAFDFRIDLKPSIRLQHLHLLMFVLRLYGPVYPLESCRGRSVYETTRFSGKA